MDSSYEHPETLEETTPPFILNIRDLVTDFIGDYGWYFLALCLIILYYWQTIQQRLDRWYNEKSDKEYAAKCKKDPDWMRKRQLEMEAARKKMQEEMDAKAALHAAKMKEKEEQRRAELLASTSTKGGQRLGSGETSSESANNTEPTRAAKKTYRPEYNPLMGSGGSGGYRPPRRGCPGGGCG
ncbi:selenoprotein S-like [Homalodisca vitripennis]|uniref:selenoprotein S-like n=1 Tax=Homalodisca vitripennis TaxID=197043 RepID=UPI001EEC3D07|nr:selenoprotein S-like [Homalodisca vitripennis]